jgi:hypothetical protein
MNNDMLMDDHDEIIAHIWQQLRRGANDRRHGFHTLTVANALPDGGVTQRVMVLREADTNARLLRFHTDMRAAKCDMIGNESPISLLAYDAKGKTQLRIKAYGRIEQNSECADAAWQKTAPFSRRCYLANPAPGTVSQSPISGLPSDLEGVEPTIERSEEGRKNFALLMTEIYEIEWLYLAHTGHRRAVFTYAAETESWSGKWLVP